MEKFAKARRWVMENCLFALAGELDPVVQEAAAAALAKLNRYVGDVDQFIIKNCIDEALNASLRNRPMLQARKPLLATLVEQIVAARFQPTAKPQARPAPRGPANTPDWRNRTPEEQSFVEKKKTMKPFAR